MIKELINSKIFELSMEEWKELITDCDKLSETVKYNPVLKSEKAIQVNIAIMRAFVFIRQYALNHQDLTERLEEIERRYNKKFQDVYDAINYLLQKDQEISEYQTRKRIGFKRDDLQ